VHGSLGAQLANLNLETARKSESTVIISQKLVPLLPEMSSDDSEDGAATLVPVPALFLQGRVDTQHEASRVPVLSMSRRSGRPQGSEEEPAGAQHKASRVPVLSMSRRSGRRIESEEKSASTAVQGPWLSLAKEGMSTERERASLRETILGSQCPYRGFLGAAHDRPCIPCEMLLGLSRMPYR